MIEHGLRQMRRLMIMSAVMALALTGCDTTAELTFQDEQLIEAVPQGLVSPECADMPDADAVFRWSVLTSFDARLTPGKRYASLNAVLEPGKNLSAEDITFTDGWFFVVDTAGRDMTCTDVADCPEGAACLSANTMGLSQYYYPPDSFCVYQTRIETVSVPKFTHFARTPISGNAYVRTDGMDGRSVAFMLDNSATLDGSAATGVPDPKKATDPYEYRKVGLNQFMDGMALTDEKSPRVEYSVHFANGMGTTGVYDVSEAWMRTAAVWQSKVMSQYPTPSGYSPIWEASDAALQKLRDTASVAYTHTMVAMTDGAPNDNTEEAYEAFRRLMTAVGRQTSLHWFDLEQADKPPHTRYAEAVKLGCGTYYLFSNPVFFSQMLRNVAINTESHWDAGIRFSARLPEGRMYRLATTFVMKVGNSAVSFEAQRLNTQNETIDHRLVWTR